MPQYVYQCTVCEKTKEITKGMNEEKPKTLKCVDASCEGRMKRVYGNVGLHVPDHFKDDSPFNYDKRPSGKKRMF